MDTITPLLDLPFETLALLAAGYLSYRIAYTGKDGSHQSIDVVFLVVVFAFIAKTAVLSVRLWPLVPRSGEAAVGFGVLAAIVAACLWRMFGERQVFYLLRAIGVSASDRYLTAWESMIGAADTKPTQVIVRLKDGSRLMCETLAEFNAERFGAVIFGQDGSVALYVTNRLDKAGTSWVSVRPTPDVDHSAADILATLRDWGYPITYVPKEEIADIEVSFRPPKPVMSNP